MSHFFVPPKAIRNNRFHISGPEAKHIATVLRKKPGETIALFDGGGKSFTGRLETVNPEVIAGEILEIRPAPPLKTKLRLIQGLPKAGKMDWIIEKGTELGFVEFYSVKTERSQVSLENVSSKTERWQRLAQAASQQCGRADIPTVHAPVVWDELWKKLPEKVLGFIPWESEEKTSLREMVQPSQRDVYLLIGPEGGFTSSEVAQAERRGFKPITLGKRIFRTETAGLIAGALILYEYGELS